MTQLTGALRHRARAAALQMLYQWEVGGIGADDAIVTYWPTREGEDELPEEARTFANALVRGTIERVRAADDLIAAHAHNWRVERMAVIDRLVLRLAIYELLTEWDTPAKVIINEAIELVRTFSGEEAVPFINGVLDAVRKKKSLGRE